ncbi:MAG TPA: hypothetical protein VHO69_17820 [Phototrophicaceae bacterium]|nr:hypothetical protein [Phototrophicaceae bacterium]
MATNDAINEYMRARLLVNRHGKLTSDQWKDMVMEPLTTLVLVLFPGVVILGPRLGAFIWGGFTFVTLAALVVLAVSLATRARRYARAPIHFIQLRAGKHNPPFWAYWKPTTLYDDSGTPWRFGKRLAPYLRLQPDASYLIYYLQEAETNVLLSLAPAEHPDAELWQPSTNFERRLTQRR